MSIKQFFKLDEYGVSVSGEFTAAVTTFVTMVYIVIVNPKILEAAGIPFGASMVATILTAVFGTLLMGIYANRPFAIAPYMGENAFIAYTVVKILGYSWQAALGAIFISGTLFTIITLLGIRDWLARSIPESMKIGFAVGIGLFITFIGLNMTGIVRIGVPGAPVHVGDFHNPAVILSIFGFLLMTFLIIRQIPGAILVSIAVVSIIAFVTGLAPTPAGIVSHPPSLSPVLLKLDIAGAFSWGFFPIILTILVMGFVDTLGTLIGLAYKGNLLDETGSLPEIEKPMLADALATVFASILGTTTAGAFVESATGIEAGGKTGLTAVLIALLFLLTLFFAPLFTAVPACAYGPALIIVGMLMVTPIVKLNAKDLTEWIPVFSIVALMSFTYNIGIGITSSFIIYSLAKVFAGNYREVTGGMWALSGISLLFFIFFPYR